MGACCASNTEAPELNDGTPGHQNRTNEGMTDAEKWALIKIQARMRGWLTRRQVKKTYGFVCSRKAPTNVVSGSEAEIKAARELVKKIQSELPPFDYNPAPAGYEGGNRTKKSREVLDNGAEYTGEWDSNGCKDG